MDVLPKFSPKKLQEMRQGLRRPVMEADEHTKRRDEIVKAAKEMSAKIEKLQDGVMQSLRAYATSDDPAQRKKADEWDWLQLHMQTISARLDDMVKTASKL